MKVVTDLVDERLRIMAQAGALNIIEYNAEAAQPLPRVVVAIDELLTLALKDKRGQFYTPLIINASQARAAGVTFLMATTDPRSDQIDAALKGNCRLRVAFRCEDWGSSVAVIDSRDANKLPAIPGRALARLPGQTDLVEVQVPFISGRELATIVTEITHRHGARPAAPPSVVDVAKISRRDRDIALFCLGLTGAQSGMFVSTAIRDGLKMRAEAIAQIRREWRERQWLIPAGANGERLSKAIRDLVGWVDAANGL
jgi:DNA segregation ATPase FtsK/SpoIIIE-like protein